MRISLGAHLLPYQIGCITNRYTALVGLSVAVSVDVHLKISLNVLYFPNSEMAPS